MPSITKYLLVYALSGFKFIFGPTLGITYGISVWETAILTTLGMMTTVYLLSYFGHEIRVLTVRIFKKRKKKRIFSPRRRRLVKIWGRYGIQGLAFLTPLLLTPPGGAILANAFGVRKQAIFKWMWISGSFWSLILTLLVKYAEGLLRDLNAM